MSEDILYRLRTYYPQHPVCIVAADEIEKLRKELDSKKAKKQCIAELLGNLRVASIVIDNLPEDPGYNGSRLIIDDSEAGGIRDAIDAAIVAIGELNG